ncbi:ABC-2 type transport system ATP-binding protein [Kineococcus xinjiangensis]|uniref:ABC-2 type transport system ATP-binding protein n=1 Tax=Kineococcus xinjiangensis TaxID=512762 RepID=A0A2S6IGW5_9ACTN|nr:ATP-binding cassette domain-containing protein [Kineococcus xinjiangensis]PPK93458.1 ABC-2 type transport system ATP-binding protein [Kineococcus xinjiangensis]
MIEAVGLRKVYGRKVAVDDLSFTVRPGIVTGFLGPNGSGKSTTMRMILGLDRPSAGRVLVDGIPYAQHRNPLGAVGALLDAKAVHTGRSAFRHLQAVAATAGIPASRVGEVIDMVGLREVARKRAGGFSLGMGQRLGIASALLADPSTVMFDEPVNGLDPDGILWIRNLMKHLASEGRAVFVSSHLMSEMALTADHLVVIGRGRLIADEPVQAFIDRTRPRGVTVRSPQVEQLRELVSAGGGRIAPAADGAFDVQGLSPQQIGDAAARAGVALHELTPQRASLEEAFMELTADSVEYQAHGAPEPAAWAPPVQNSPQQETAQQKVAQEVAR